MENARRKKKITEGVKGFFSRDQWLNPKLIMCKFYYSSYKVR